MTKKLKGSAEGTGTWPDYLVNREYCKPYKYWRNGNVAVPGLFIYSGGKRRGNYLDWRKAGGLGLYIYIYIYIYTHTHTHIYIYIYIYIYSFE